MPNTITTKATGRIGRARGRPAQRGGAQYVKKKTKRGAYKKSAKNQMAIRRAPIVETKQRVHSDIAAINGYLPGGGSLVNPLNWRTLVTDDAFTLLPLSSYYRNSHGFNEWNVIGHNIFSKYLNLKMQLRFPQNELMTFTDPEGTSYTAQNRMIQDPTKVYLICGWITQSMNYPVSNSPSPSLPAQTQADVDAIETYITQQLKPYFDDDEDKLQFRPKQTTNIKIEKYVQLRPKLDSAIGTQAVPIHTMATTFDGQAVPSGGSGQPNLIAYGPNNDASISSANVRSSTNTSGHGSIPEVAKSHSWKCMKKLALTEGKEAGFTNDKQNLYPNNSWLPFAVIYNPNFEQQVANTLVDPVTGRFTQVQFMEYRHNDAHYFTDS